MNDLTSKIENLNLRLEGVKDSLRNAAGFEDSISQKEIRLRQWNSEKEALLPRKNKLKTAFISLYSIGGVLIVLFITFLIIFGIGTSDISSGIEAVGIVLSLYFGYGAGILTLTGAGACTAFFFVTRTKINNRTEKGEQLEHEISGMKTRMNYILNPLEAEVETIEGEAVGLKAEYPNDREEVDRFLARISNFKAKIKELKSCR